MLRDLYELPEYQIVQRVRHLQVSLELFRRNHQKLSSLLKGFESSEPLRFLGNVNDWKRQELMKEVMFSLHDFVAAATSLVNHSRVLYNDLYREAGVFPEYKDEIRKRFASDPAVQFLHCLRNMAQHYRLPNVNFTTAIRTDGRILVSVELLKSDLVKFSGWNVHARRYLDEVVEKCDLSSLVEEYHTKVIDYYRWLVDRQQRLHQADMQRLREVQDAELQRQKPVLMKRILEELSRCERAGRGSLIQILQPVLSSDDRRDLHRLEPNAVEWTSSALSRIQARFHLPDDVVARVQRFSRHIHESGGSAAD